MPEQPCFFADDQAKSKQILFEQTENKTLDTEIVPPAEEVQVPCYLDASHTFDSFVVGKSNEFAYAAA